MNDIRDRSNTVAWKRYWQTYLPRIRKWCSAASLSGDDLEEAVSMVLAKIVQTMEAGWIYDPRRTYRGWLWRVCYSQVQEFREQKTRIVAKGSGQSSVLEQLHEFPAPTDSDATEETISRMVENAVERIKASLGDSSEKWRCFQLTALENRKGKDVAQQLGITVGLVHQNKSRVAAAIREEVERLRDENRQNE